MAAMGAAVSTREISTDRHRASATAGSPTVARTPVSAGVDMAAFTSSGEVSNRTQGAYGSRTTAQQRQAAATRNLAAERADWDNYSRTWSGYYGNVAYDRGLAVGAAVAAVPAGAYQLNYLGTNYWYASGYWYAAQSGQYVVVNPVEGAVVPEPPPSCTPVETPRAAIYQCGGAYYTEAPEGSR